MNYQETLQYLFSRLPVFQREGQSAYKPGLDNTKLLDAHLGHPHTKYKTIHVAGTNGKGSVSHLLASVLQHAGYKVGLYTSPHLKDFRERIRVNGQPVSEQYVCDFTEQHHAFFEQLDTSFFEVTMSMAFQYFADTQVDVAVVEVGLGGRLDSTNIISPELCVITNISFDHMNLLGNTLEKIAAEKAGIIKPGIPVVIGEAEGGVKQVFAEKATAEKAPVFFAQEETKVVLLNSHNGVQTYDCTGFGSLIVGLGGIYQQKNTATAITVTRELRKLHFSLPDSAVRRGFATVCETTGLQGRWQRLQTSPLVVCDTGHNEGGIRYIVEQLQALPCKTIRMVFGMVNDKDIHTVLGLLPRQAVYYFCRANIPRALPSEEMQRQAATFGLAGRAYPTVEAALDAAKREASADDVIFVGGSTFVVAEVV